MHQSDHIERQIINLMKIIKNNSSFMNYVINFKGNNGFMWDTNPILQQIYDLVDKDGHSGSSFVLCLRECQVRLKQS